MTWFSVWEKRARRKAVATVTWLDPVQQPNAQNTESVSPKNSFLMKNKGERTRSGVIQSSESSCQVRHPVKRVILSSTSSCQASHPVKYVILSSESSCQVCHPVKRVILSSECPPQHYHGIRTVGVKKLCQKIRTLLLLSCAYVSCPQNGN